jgi:hypothetical protein
MSARDAHEPQGAGDDAPGRLARVKHLEHPAPLGPGESQSPDPRRWKLEGPGLLWAFGWPSRQDRRSSPSGSTAASPKSAANVDVQAGWASRSLLRVRA